MSLLAPQRPALVAALALALAGLVLAPTSPAGAQRVVGPGRRGGAVVVEPPRRGGAVVVEPGRRGGRGAVVVEPPRRGGAVVVDPGRRGGAVVVDPGRRGGAVVVDPPRRGGAVVVDPGRRDGAVVVAPDDRGRRGVVIVGPRGVVRAAPPRVRVVAPPPPPRPRARWAPPSRHGDVWIQPYWGWTGGSWEWVEGHWEQPPQPDAIWIDPQFEGGGWVPGYWTTPPSSSAARFGRPFQIGTQLAGSFSASDDRDWSGALYHDYVVSMSADETATFLLVGGPHPQRPGQRIDVALQVLSNGVVVATGSTQTGSDAQVTFTSSQAAIYLIRASSRGADYGASYLLQSSSGQWAPQASPYDDYWGSGGGGYYEAPPQAYPEPAYPDCRRTLLDMGHDPSSLMFCDGAEPYCAAALLQYGHAPSSLMFCRGVDAQCAVSLLQSGRSPTELQYCR